MKALIFVVALPAAAQNYNCSQMYDQQVYASASPKCLAIPFAYPQAWTYHVWLQNTHTNATVQSQNVDSSAQGWCNGFGSNCSGVSNAPDVVLVPGQWRYQDHTTGIDPGGAQIIGPWGCGAFVKANGLPVYMNEITCPCVSSTCGYVGCPKCPQCPTQNSQCIGTGTALQNLCNYPATGCGGTYPTLFYTQNAGPCCRQAGSPIIIDIDGSGYTLTDAAHGVPFNFFGTGKVQIAWTQAASTNAFLVWDRNGDGKIDNGTELFGNLTVQPPSPDQNGFAALALLDTDSDGWIDAATEGAMLRLWIDTNHDGLTDPGELHTLSEFGIARISTAYKTDEKKDRYGNVFRYRGTIDNDKNQNKQIYDVLLQVAP